MTTTTTAAGPTNALLDAINAAFNSRDVDRIIAGDKILGKDTYWKLVEKADRL
jgi:hypothetical protein